MPETILLLAGAGLLAGAMNALAGGGSFVTLPALIAVGVPSVAANATSTVALYPGGLASAWVYRGGLGQVAGVPAVASAAAPGAEAWAWAEGAAGWGAGALGEAASAGPATAAGPDPRGRGALPPAVPRGHLGRAPAARGGQDRGCGSRRRPCSPSSSTRCCSSCCRR